MQTWQLKKEASEKRAISILEHRRLASKKLSENGLFNHGPSNGKWKLTQIKTNPNIDRVPSKQKAKVLLNYNRENLSMFVRYHWTCLSQTVQQDIRKRH